MPEISAFVGHSFAEEDKMLVGQFLDYLTKLAGVIEHFSWEHAEDAEPRTLTHQGDEHHPRKKYLYWNMYKKRTGPCRCVLILRRKLAYSCCPSIQAKG